MYCLTVDAGQVRPADWERINARQSVDALFLEAPDNWRFRMWTADRMGNDDVLTQVLELRMHFTPDPALLREATEEEELCLICMEHVPTRKCMPCGHINLCEVDVERLLSTVDIDATGRNVPKNVLCVVQ